MTEKRVLETLAFLVNGATCCSVGRDGLLARIHAEEREQLLDSSPREGMIALGRLAFPTFTSTTIGKVIFSVAGNSWVRALNLVTKAYEVSIRPGMASVAEVTETSARVELRQIWNFGNSYQVGVFEGAMKHFGVRGSVRAVRVDRRCDVDLIMHWEA